MKVKLELIENTIKSVSLIQSDGEKTFKIIQIIAELSSVIKCITETITSVHDKC